MLKEKCGKIETKFHTERINTSVCLYYDVDHLAVPVKSGRRRKSQKASQNSAKSLRATEQIYSLMETTATTFSALRTGSFHDYFIEEYKSYRFNL